MNQTTVGGKKKYLQDDDAKKFASDKPVEYNTKADLEAAIEQAKKNMREASKDLDFLTAAEFRDEMNALKNSLKRNTNKKINPIHIGNEFHL